MAFGIAKGLVILTLRVLGFAARILPVISTGSVCAHLQSTRLSMREFAQFARTRETDPASARSYTGNGLGPIGASSLRSLRAQRCGSTLRANSVFALVSSVTNMRPRSYPWLLKAGRHPAASAGGRPVLTV
jgi:hypothetical protein